MAASDVFGLVMRPRKVRAVGSRALSAVAQQEWLDRPSYRLEHVLTIVFAGFGGARERVSNALHGTWLGHPLHPALTTLPVGAITTTVALDGAATLSRIRGATPGHASGMRDASRLTLGIGILGSLGAAATGLTDWQHTQEHSRRVGLVHGVLNAAATGLYVTSYRDRRRGRHGRAAAVSALGYGISLASGYLGAALVYTLGTGVDRSGERLDVADWTPVLPVAGLREGRPQRAEVDGVGLVLYRHGDSVVAVGEFCPHLGAPMSDGWIDRGRVVCPWHGSRFAVASGEVMRGPSTSPLPCYQTRLRDGMIELRSRTA